MSSEFSIVALHGLLIVLTIMAQSSLGTLQYGFAYNMSSRDEPREMTGVAARLDRAANNMLIGFALFAAAVLVLHAQGRLGAATLIAAQVVLGARVVYVACYAAGVPYVRSLAWLASTAATVWLLWLAL
jgi:uncharacterized MAPEG superfamily protein